MLKTLLGQVREYKKDSLLTPLFTALEVLMEVLIPFVTAAIIDQGIEEGNMQSVYAYGALMLVMAFLSLVFGALAGTRPGPPPALPPTCAKGFMPAYRLFPFQTSINTAPPVW